MSSTIRGFPRRVVFDWSPEAGDHEAWLAELCAAGWEPDVGSAGAEGSTVRIGGRQIVRHALRESAAAQAAREAEQVRPEPEASAGRPVWHDRDQASDEDWSSFELPEQSRSL